MKKNKFLIMFIFFIGIIMSCSISYAARCPGCGASTYSIVHRDSSSHRWRCSRGGCQWSTTESHSFGGGSYCLDCGYSKHSHSYSEVSYTAPTCTTAGTRVSICSCGDTQSSTIPATGHKWSEWKYNTEEHWKECNNNCGSIDSKEAHHDNNIDGFCDDCNYVMAIPGMATISGPVSVKIEESAGFSITVTAGTEPITYQWYYNSSDSTTGGTAIDGETDTAIYIDSTTKEMNGRYYYCAMSNKAGTHYSPTALLTVYYPFTIANLDDVAVKKGEIATYTVEIVSEGSPNEYTYQWYIVDPLTGDANKISGATDKSYSIIPIENIHAAYYYCVVSNGQYDVTSNRAKLTADITSPVITMENFNQNLIINKNDTLVINFTVTDTGEGYIEDNDNFTKEDFIIKTDGVVNNNVTKNLVYNSSSGNTHSYTLTISNMTGNGKLSLEVPDGSIEDNFHNVNDLSIFNTNVIVDNIAPVISVESVDEGINGKYANLEDKIVIKLAITEAVGIDIGEFEASDITINVGGKDIIPNGIKRLDYVEKIGNKYIYTLTISGVSDDGEIRLDIDAEKIKDLANNPNEETSLILQNSSGENIIIDNRKPTIDSLVTKFDSYTSSRDYPDSLEAKHKNWAKEDIFVQINATDDQQIDYYTKSEDGITHVMTPEQYVIDEPINTEMVYRVYDMAGNYSEIKRVIKLDKTSPKPPALLLTEQRENGAAYIFNDEEPSSKTIYVKPNPATIVDFGDIQSGINIDDSDYPYTFYFTIKRYKDIDKTVEMGETVRYEFTDVAILRDSGYYEIEAFMSDIAGNIAFIYDANGNKVEKVSYQVYINKGVENTIRIKNINDVGSGISRVIINIYDEDGNEAISEIVIDDPYKEIVKNVRLREGKFDVKVTLIDKVGNTKIKTATITNIF